MDSQKYIRDLVSTPPNLACASKFHRELECWWDNFISKYYPAAELIKWGTLSRTYQSGNRIVKVRSKFTGLMGNQTLGHQYKIWVLVSNKHFSTNPEYCVIDNDWEVLELDCFSGSLLTPKFIKQHPWSVPLRTIIWLMFVLSMKGVYFKQLRLLTYYLG